MAAKQLNNVRHQGLFSAGSLAADGASLMWRTRPFKSADVVAPKLRATVTVFGSFGGGTAVLQFYDGTIWRDTTFTSMANAVHDVEWVGLAFRINLTGATAPAIDIMVVADAPLEEVVAD